MNREEHSEVESMNKNGQEIRFRFYANYACAKFKKVGYHQSSKSPPSTSLMML